MFIICLLATIGLMVVIGGVQVLAVVWPVILIALGIKGIVDKLNG